MKSGPGPGPGPGPGSGPWISVLSCTFDSRAGQIARFMVKTGYLPCGGVVQGPTTCAGRGVPGVYLSYISVISQFYLRYISVYSQLYLSYISVYLSISQL